MMCATKRYTLSMQALSRTGRFDFIKIDIEGEERQILSDPASRAVLCEAVCIFMELHDRFAPGCSNAFRAFLAAGCNGRFFSNAVQTREYSLWCQVLPHA